MPYVHKQRIYLNPESTYVPLGDFNFAKKIYLRSIFIVFQCAFPMFFMKKYADSLTSQLRILLQPPALRESDQDTKGKGNDKKMQEAGLGSTTSLAAGI